MNERKRTKIWQVLQWPLIVLLLGVLGLVPLFGQQDSFYLYQPPLNLPSGQYIAGAGTETKVIVVIVDGLRVDQAEKLKLWDESKKQGAWGTLLTQPPSWSDPCFSNIITGTWPEFHSVSSNEFQGKIPVDTIFRTARSIGLTVAFCGDGKWLSLIPSPLDYSFGIDSSADPEGADLSILEKGLEFLAKGPDLLFVHFNQVDHASHFYGTSSQESERALANVDSLLSRFLSQVDGGKYVLFLISDHGHRAQGGHGGGEEEVLTTPLLIWGKGIISGGPLRAGQVDLAPTLAVLIGCPFPAYNLGNPLFSAITLSEKNQALAEFSLLETRFSFARAYGSLVGEEIRRIDFTLGKDLEEQEKWAALFRWSEEQLRELDSSIVEIREYGLARERLSRLWAPILATLACLLLILLGKKRGWPLAFLDAAVILILLVLFFTYIFGQTFSFSTLPSGNVLVFLLIFAPPLFLPTILVLLAIPLQCRKKSSEERWLFAGKVLLSVSLLLLLLFAFVYYANGLVSTWHLLDFSLGFLILAILLFLVFNGLFSLFLLPIIYFCWWRTQHR